MRHRQFIEWTRAEERRHLDVPAIAYREDGSRIGVLMSDLSYEGCRLATDKGFASGERITLVVMELGTEILAEVRWASPGKLGARFLDGALMAED
ncbi:MAG: PilZ domain-containing protein [Sphingomicrobium sp.]|nr:PilZ domain-containing protein [Sphingomonadales bacterium]